MITTQVVNGKNISNNCVQLTIPYSKRLIIFDKDDIVFFAKDSKVIIDRFANDHRKKYFSSSLFDHEELFNFKRTHIINLMFEINKVYLRIVDNNIMENYVIKIGNDYYLYNITVDSVNEKLEVNNDELDKIYNGINNEKVFAICDDGSIISNSTNTILQTKKNNKKEIFKDMLDKLLKYNECFFENSEYYQEFCKTLYNAIDEYDIKNNMNNVVFDNGYIVNINGEKIDLSHYLIKNLSNNNYSISREKYLISSEPNQKIELLDEKTKKDKSLKLFRNIFQKRK